MCNFYKLYNFPIYRTSDTVQNSGGSAKWIQLCSASSGCRVLGSLFLHFSLLESPGLFPGPSPPHIPGVFFNPWCVSPGDPGHHQLQDWVKHIWFLFGLFKFPHWLQLFVTITGALDLLLWKARHSLQTSQWLTGCLCMRHSSIIIKKLLPKVCCCNFVPELFLSFLENWTLAMMRDTLFSNNVFLFFPCFLSLQLYLLDSCLTHNINDLQP